MGSLLLSPGSWCTQGSACALQESISPAQCKFWQLYGGVNGNLPQEGLCHTQVCCTQSPCPCGSPLLTHTSSGDSLCGVSGSWCTDLFEPSEHLWWVWGLILNAILPHLASCWGFSFAPGCRVFSQSLSSAVQLLPQHCAAVQLPPPPRPLPINRKLDSRFTEHASTHQNKTQFPPQSVSPIRKFPQASILLHQRADRMKTTITEN